MCILAMFYGLIRLLKLSASNVVRGEIIIQMERAFGYDTEVKCGKYTDLTDKCSEPPLRISQKSTKCAA